jgi:hypothetical protein
MHKDSQLVLTPSAAWYRAALQLFNSTWENFTAPQTAAWEYHLGEDARDANCTISKQLQASSEVLKAAAKVGCWDLL